MTKVLICYQLENNKIPEYIIDGGYFYNAVDETLIGVAKGPPGGVKVLSLWDLKDIVLNLHNNQPFVTDSDGTTSLTDQEVLDLAEFFYVEKIGEPTIEDVRLHRDKLLKDSDVLTLADYPLGGVSTPSVITYRQELRDITDNLPSDIKTLVWPTDPTK